MRDVICLTLMTAILGVTTLEASENSTLTVLSGRSPAEQALNIKERLLELPPGSLIEVRLLNKQKLRGKLGQMDDEGFNLTAVKQGKVVTQKIAFSELKSFKQVTSAKVKTGHTFLYILAGIGVFMVIMIIWSATQIG